MARGIGWWVTGLLGLWLLSGHQVRAQTPVELTAGSVRMALGEHTRYHHDVEGSAGLEQALDWLRERRFAPLPDDGTAFGFRPGAFWFHVRAINRAGPQVRWLLVQHYALSDRIEVYVRSADGRTSHQASGDSLPFRMRGTPYRHPNFWLDLPPDQPVDLFVRVRSQSSMQVPLSLYTAQGFIEEIRHAQLGIGLYYGILVALFVYNLALWLSVRDAGYFWYLFHLGTFGLVLFTLNGLGFEYLWPNSAWLADHSVPLSICLAQIGMQQFARVFLGLRQRWPRGDNASMALIAFFLLLALAATRLPYHVSTPIASAAVLLSVSWIAVVSLVVLRRDYRPARLFLLAWGLFLLGTAAFAAVAFGLLPKTFLTEYGVQIGSALEMLLLSIALGHRYAALRTENERIAREANEQLEQKVQHRTAELRSALAQLEDAHARLRESSQRDVLTGLYNRGHFRDSLETLLHQSHEQGTPLSLLMIDLDDFKQVNDRHGHPAGDECLRWTARTLGQALRPYRALLARFGGEEFIVALPDMDLLTATHVAEDLRRQLRSNPCRCGELDIVVTASIGVHAIGTMPSHEIDQLLQHADQALYRAKADGRDCVRTWQAAPA